MSNHQFLSQKDTVQTLNILYMLEPKLFYYKEPIIDQLDKDSGL